MEAAASPPHEPDGSAAASPHEPQDVPPSDFWDRPLDIYEDDASLREDSAPPSHEPTPGGAGVADAHRGAPPASAARDGSRDAEPAAGDAAHGEAMAMLQRLFPGKIVEVEPNGNVPADDAEREESG